MLLELASVVREDVLERNGEHHLTEAEKLLGSFGSMGCRGPGEGETTVDILERDNVAPAAVDEAFNGIQGNAVTGVSGPEVLGLAQHPLPVGSHNFPRMRQNLLREDAQPSQISDEPAHGGDGGDWKCLPPAVSSQKDLQLLFSKIGMLHPELLDLVEHLKWPRTDAVLHGYLRTFIQSFRFPSAFPQSLLPEKKRSPLHTEGIHRGFKTVLLPENENCKLLLGFVCHMLPPYRSVVTGYEVKAFECRLEASSTHRSLLTQGVQYVSEPMHERGEGEGASQNACILVFWRDIEHLYFRRSVVHISSSVPCSSSSPSVFSIPQLHSLPIQPQPPHISQTSWPHVSHWSIQE